MTNITRSTLFFGALALSALTTAACGGESRQEARDPSTATSPSESSTMTTSSENPTTTTTTTAPAPARTTASGDRTDTAMGTGSSSSSAAPSTMGTSSPAPQPSATDAPVANNPGSAEQTKSADNTKNNDRDRHGALTPMDQGNSGAETKVTAAVRKGIMAEKSLSFSAKNVKVITTGTKVTLRGTVKSDQEKTTIADIAKRTDGVTDVDNQLEVKK